MRINYNVSAMLSNNALANNDNLLAQSLERLSSGLKINHAKDNPAGLAMAKRMNAQIEGLSQANDNANDGISVIETADGAMSEISEMLQRMNELAIKSANGTMSEGDRSIVQDEVSQLKEEIARVAETTEFNGQKLLNGEFELKGYVYGDIDVKVAGYSKEVPAKNYFISGITLQKEMVKTPV
ncbi:MAG: flagellin FliC3, partial [Acetatifactor sp.]|nr:flagellin FliC3 [Acetatifactor sp.]